MTDEQALCLHLMASLALPFTLPSDRVTSLALLREHLPCLMAERFAAMRLAADSMLRAKTHLEWSFAAHEATAALVPVFKAESCRIIASLSVKRVA
jgi:hypothetical protein